MRYDRNIFSKRLCKKRSKTISLINDHRMDYFIFIFYIREQINTKQFDYVFKTQ